MVGWGDKGGLRDVDLGDVCSISPHKPFALQIPVEGGIARPTTSCSECAMHN